MQKISAASNAAEYRPEFIPMEAAALTFGCTVKTIRRMIDRGELTGYRIGARMLRVDKREVDALASPVAFSGEVSA